MTSNCVGQANVRLQGRAVFARPLEGPVMCLLDLEHIAQALEIVLLTSRLKEADVQPIPRIQKTAFLSADNRRDSSLRSLK
jgi:hypothetical protein